MPKARRLKDWQRPLGTPAKEIRVMQIQNNGWSITINVGSEYGLLPGDMLLVSGALYIINATAARAAICLLPHEVGAPSISTLRQVVCEWKPRVKNYE